MALKYLVLMVLMFGPTAWALNIMRPDPFLEEVCVQNGGRQAYEKFQKVEGEVNACVQPIFEILGQSLKRGSDYYTLFKKNCPEIEKATKCLDDGVKAVSSCFNVEEMENIKYMSKTMKQTVKFICHDHAERIRLFIAEGGLECVKTNKDIRKCTTEVLNANIHGAYEDSIFRGLLKDKSYGDKECDAYKKLEECFVDPMKTCKSSAPADFVQSLFKEAFKGTPCDNKMSTGIIVLIAVVVLAIVASIVVVAYKKQISC